VKLPRSIPIAAPIRIAPVAATALIGLFIVFRRTPVRKSFAAEPKLGAAARGRAVVRAPSIRQLIMTHRFEEHWHAR
jgi:hypothetical protein